MANMTNYEKMKNMSVTERKPRRTIKVKCIDCGKVHEAKAKSNLRCDECRKAWANRQSKKYKDRKWLQTQTVKRGTTRPKMSIREVVKAIEKHNKMHNTRYTYDQFVALMEGGKIYVE